jgi:hypothetical protein
VKGSCEYIGARPIRGGYQAPETTGNIHKCHERKSITCRWEKNIIGDFKQIWVWSGFRSLRMGSTGELLSSVTHLWLHNGRETDLTTSFFGSILLLGIRCCFLPDTQVFIRGKVTGQLKTNQKEFWTSRFHNKLSEIYQIRTTINIQTVDGDIAIEKIYMITQEFALIL